MENVQRWTTERYRQPFYGCGSNVPMLQECFQPRHKRCSVMSNDWRATDGNGSSLAGGKVCRAVVMLVARLITLVRQHQRGAVGCVRKLADVPDDDEDRRETQQPARHESRTPSGLHLDEAYRAVPLVSRNGVAVAFRAAALIPSTRQPRLLHAGCGIGSWGLLAARSEYGRLCHGDGGHEGGDRCRSGLMLATLRLLALLPSNGLPLVEGCRRNETPRVPDCSLEHAARGHRLGPRVDRGQCGVLHPGRMEAPPGHHKLSMAVAGYDDRHSLRGRDVVAGRQLLMCSSFDREAESLGQDIEGGGLGEAATHGRSVPRCTSPARGRLC